MTIPRGYIPGKTDFPVITSATGNISLDNDNLETSGAITCNGLNSPDIKAILASHDYQYVYDWSALPANSNHKWNTASGTGTSQSIVDGELIISDIGGASSNLINYRESGSILSTDIVIVEHTGRFVSSNISDVMFIQVTDAKNQGGGTYKSIPLLWKQDGTGVIFNTTSISIDTTVTHEYTVVKDAENGSYLFIDDELKCYVSYNDMITRSISYGGTYNLVFGTSYSLSTSIVEYVSTSFKYSKLREGSKELNATSSKIVGGNIDVKNQAETEGVQIQSSKIASSGTNQTLFVEGNGTGGVIIDPNQGTTASRPTPTYNGEFYFDTTLGKPIWHNGTNWIDATGTIV